MLQVADDAMYTFATWCEAQIRDIRQRVLDDEGELRGSLRGSRRLVQGAELDNIARTQFRSSAHLDKAVLDVKRSTYTLIVDVCSVERAVVDHVFLEGGSRRI